MHYTQKKVFKTMSFFNKTGGGKLWRQGKFQKAFAVNKF